MSREPARAQETAPCTPAIARVVSLQGEVAVQRAGSGAWSRVQRLDTSICAGDRLRTAGLSRAALFVQPETLVRVDQNTIITLRQSADEVLVEFHTDDLTAEAHESESCGAGYFITRFPKKFKVTTAHLNAAVEGTEFMVESSCKATALTVLEGQVHSQVAGTQESRSLTAGQKLETGPDAPTAFSTVIRPTDAVQWVLRYPPLSDAGVEVDATTAGRAEALLRVGQVDDALREIDSALAVKPSDAATLALRAIIQIAKNDKAAALESAKSSTAVDAANYRGWLALSYAQQAGFDLDVALASARRAQSLRAESSLAHARVAELLLSLGDVKNAEVAARTAIASKPVDGHAHSILGFVHLAKIDTAAARLDFEVAINRDSFSALPRLGLGLAMVRDGELAAGREQFEIAVALDPSNSLLRSYIGKAYYEENTRQRDALAAAQFNLASNLDPLDPTAYFYDAVLKHSENRPVEALELFLVATTKNDNRAVYRSQLLVDDDAAAQGATIAAIFGDLGFERLAVNESARALQENAGNASAHRELAAAYSTIPRHDIARVSEALQAQIRQPVSNAPVPPILGTDSFLVLKDVGPSLLGPQEFNQLFNRNDLEITAEALAGSRDSVGGQLALGGLADRLAYSLSALDYETDGFIENDAAARAVYDLFVQAQLQPGSTIQAAVKHSEIDVGQTFFPFEPTFAEPTTISEVSDSFRVSGHYSPEPRVDWIWTAVYEDRTREIFAFPDSFLLTGNDSETAAIEIQNLLRVGNWQIISGAGYVEQQDAYIEQIDVSTTAANFYAYGHWQSQSLDLGVQIGLSADSFELDNSVFANRIQKERVNPRVGFVWSTGSGTTIRAAAASTLKRPLVRSQTIEPTQVVGFNQYFTGFERFFGDPDGTVSERLGIALDQDISETFKAGVEVTRRHLEVAQLEGDFDWDERSALAYLYKTMSFGVWQGAVSLDGQFEKVDRPPEFTGAEGILDLETIRVPLALRLFSERGMTLRAAVTYVRQEGRFTLFVGEPVFTKDDDGVIADFTFEYLLPRRKGSIAVGVNNAFDEFVDLVEIDPLNPVVATRQLFFARVRYQFST